MTNTLPGVAVPGQKPNPVSDEAPGWHVSLVISNSPAPPAQHTAHHALLGWVIFFSAREIHRVCTILNRRWVFG